MKKQPTFKEKVYAVVRRIPKGKVATYGDVARMAGNSSAARAVGMCMKYNPDRNDVPCHRVVGHDGRLTGYAYGSGVATKKRILQREKVVFKGDRADIAASGWYN